MEGSFDDCTAPSDTLFRSGLPRGIRHRVSIRATNLRATHRELPDPKLTLLYGQYTLTFAVVAFMAAREKEARSKLSLAVLMVTARNAVASGYLLVAGMERLSQAGPPLVVNCALTVLLILFRKK